MPTDETRPPEPTASGFAGIDLVVFSAGDLRCAVEARYVLAIAPIGPDDALAFSEFLGRAPTTNTQQRLLCLRDSGAAPSQHALWRVDEPILLHHAQARDVQPLPPLVLDLTALRCLRGVVRLGDTQDTLALLIDPLRLGDQSSGAPPVVEPQQCVVAS
jgi:hypothetical protein